MKTPLAVALVLVGGALIIAPITANYFLKANHQANVVRLLEKPESRTVSLQREEMNSTYSFGCWLIGALAIGASIFFSVRTPHSAHAAERSPSASTSP
jgi:hypothetical protein